MSALPPTGSPWHTTLAVQAQMKSMPPTGLKYWRAPVKLGLADPRFDASGYRALMAVALAEELDERYTYFDPLFADQFTTPITIFRG